MGGGGAMRTAAKVAGIGVANASGIRGVGISAVPPPAEHSVRNASRPVSAIVSSSSSSSSKADVSSSAVQRPAWELDDWEFAGGVEEDQEQELIFGSGIGAEPIPRLVFPGAPPSLQEAQSATTELKDALEKLYLSSPINKGSDGSFGVGQLSGISWLANSDHLETKSCNANELKATAMPKYAMKAFALLHESPEAQTVVASIASDPNVWNAVLKNEALTEFLQSHKTSDEVQDPGSPRKFTEISHAASEAGSSETGFMDIFENIKLTLEKMVSNVTAVLQNVFGFSSADHISATADGNARPMSMEKILGAPFMALAVIVIMVVVLKRG